MGKNVTLVAKTLFGFEDILAKELHDLGALQIQKGMRMVSFLGDLGFMYKANLACRTAIKILRPIQEFEAHDEQALYDGIYAMDWSVYLTPAETLAIDATVFSDKFTHSKYVALKCKDAIVDQFRNKTGIRPNIDVDAPDLRINIHIHQFHCTVSLDSSGQSLHQRGYKVSATIAPINEVLAAGMLLMAGWEGQCCFVDPMCGSGTIVAEAAMIAMNKPANMYREEFAFERWKDFDPVLYQTIREALLKKIRPFVYSIYGYDKDIQAMKKAKININQAELEDVVEIRQQDFFRSVKSCEGKCFMMFNPPYDERISIDTEDFYSQIGSTLKHHYPDTEVWMITANVEALKQVGLKPDRKIKLFNGSLEARLVRYMMYAGSRKQKSDLL